MEGDGKEGGGELVSAKTTSIEEIGAVDVSFCCVVVVGLSCQIGAYWNSTV